ncbi:hypothetical protein [Dongia sp.]|uniref:hypothetical protein n=1 Tax=Dongia sp. TaxID=1977262 RepID=UPI003750281C
MRAFGFLTATVLILAAAAGSRAASASDLADCKEAVARGSFISAIPICRMALMSAETPEDKITARQMIAQTQAGMAALRERKPRVFDQRMVMNPDANPQRRGDEEIVINRGPMTP